MRLLRLTTMGVLGGACGVALSASVAHGSSFGIITEAVQTYNPINTPNPCFTGSNLVNTIANAAGFTQNMTAGGQFWLWHDYVDQSVFDTDFYDPDVTLSVWDNDTNNFDPASVGVGLSFFSGHGAPANWATTQTCTHGSQCTSPGAGQSFPSFCQSAPGFPNAPSGGLCVYNAQQSAVTNSSNDKHCGAANYGSGLIKLGESGYSGGWAGAGTNGQTNLAVWSISNGVGPDLYYYQLAPMFAGLHLTATIMPTNGDTSDVADRGAAFANHWKINDGATVGQSWLDVINDLPQTDGGPCNNSYATYGGGHGINGCGCNVVFSVDGGTTPHTSNYHVYSETWQQIADDSYDAVGQTHWDEAGACNYAVNAYPLSL